MGDTTFVEAYSTSYGAYYAGRGVEQNVIELDLYSEGLGLDSAGIIVGTGSNLYFSDIFLPSTEQQLLAGTYHSDTTGSAYTFLPGVDYEGNISGAYLLLIDNGILAGYTIFEDGSFVAEQDADTMRISFSMKYNEYGVQKTYNAVFRGVISTK